jgi:hypothetical protein
VRGDLAQYSKLAYEFFGTDFPFPHLSCAPAFESDAGPFQVNIRAKTIIVVGRFRTRGALAANEEGA